MEAVAEVQKTSEDDKKVKKEYVMTEARQENLKRAREKASRLRQQLKENKPVKPKPKSKMEIQLEELDKKMNDINKDEPTKSTIDKPMDNTITERTKPDVHELEKPQQDSTTRKVKEEPTITKPVEQIYSKEEPKVEPKVEPKPEPKIEPPKPKPPLYKREGGFLYM